MNTKQATVFLLVLALGIVSAFFLFKHLKKESEPLLVDENGNTQPIDSPAPDTTPGTTSSPTVAPVPPTSPTTTPDSLVARKADDLFRNPEKLMGALNDLVKERDAEAFIALAGEEAISPPTRSALVDLLNNPAYAPAATDPVISLARFDDLTRWAIQLDPVVIPETPSAGPATTTTPPVGNAPDSDDDAGTTTPSSAPTGTTAGATPTATASAGPADNNDSPPSATPAPVTSAPAGTGDTAPAITGPSSSTAMAKAKQLPSRQIYIDIKEGDDKLWKIKKVLVPLPAGDGSTGVLPPSADSVTVAHGFSRAVLGGDFKTARALADPEKVTDERIAALMIALEEGAYRLQSDRPLVQTLSRDTVSWIVARVQNADTVSEFGLEMSKLDPKLGWLIDNMSFDKVIQMTATAAGGGNIAYAPIVKNPQGGDSLVVFFEFDSADLNVRSERQVRMIADILKGNPGHQIKINGHADALGLDDYNRTLSARRAHTVRGALISLGVSSDQIVAAGLGASVPLSPNFKPDGSDNPSGRSQNRRSEIYLDF